MIHRCFTNHRSCFNTDVMAMNRRLLSRHSGRAWLESDKDVQLFNKKLKRTLTKLERAKKIMRFLRMPSAFLRKLLSIPR